MTVNEPSDEDDLHLITPLNANNAVLFSTMKSRLEEQVRLAKLVADHVASHHLLLTEIVFF